MGDSEWSNVLVAFSFGQALYTPGQMCSENEPHLAISFTWLIKMNKFGFTLLYLDFCHPWTLINSETHAENGSFGNARETCNYRKRIGRFTAKCIHFSTSLAGNRIRPTPGIKNLRSGDPVSVETLNTDCERPNDRATDDKRLYGVTGHRLIIFSVRFNRKIQQPKTQHRRGQILKF